MANRDFKGIWIPKEIWLSADLTLQEKVFLVEITSLDNEDGCFANNEYFAQFFGLSKVRVSEVINSLVEKGFITSQIKACEGNKRILKTLANFYLRPSQTFIEDPRKPFFKHSNTDNNTGNSTDKKQIMTFEEFWSLYPKKVGKTTCEPKWKKLPDSDIQKIKDTLKDWIAYKPFTTYNHPNPETYINQKRWNDEIPTVPVKPNPLAPRPSSNPINPYDAFR